MWICRVDEVLSGESGDEGGHGRHRLASVAKSTAGEAVGGASHHGQDRGGRAGARPKRRERVLEHSGVSCTRGPRRGRTSCSSCATRCCAARASQRTRRGCRWSGVPTAATIARYDRAGSGPGSITGGCVSRCSGLPFPAWSSGIGWRSTCHAGCGRRLAENAPESAATCGRRGGTRASGSRLALLAGSATQAGPFIVGRAADAVRHRAGRRRVGPDCGPAAGS